MIYPWSPIGDFLYYLIVFVGSSMSLNLYFSGEPSLHFATDKTGYWTHQISTILIGLFAGKYVLEVWPNNLPVFVIAGWPIGVFCGLVWLAIFNPIYELLRR